MQETVVKYMHCANQCIPCILVDLNRGVSRHRKCQLQVPPFPVLPPVVEVAIEFIRHDPQYGVDYSLNQQSRN